MPFYHVSPNAFLDKLTPRVCHRTRPEENDSRKVVCAAKSISACLALIPHYDGRLAVYELEDDGKWFQADYPHEEAVFEYRRLSPIKCKLIGFTDVKRGRGARLRGNQKRGAHQFPRVLKKAEVDKEYDLQLLTYVVGRDDQPPPPPEIVDIANDNPTGRVVNGFKVSRVIRIRKNNIVAYALTSFHTDNRSYISLNGGETWWETRNSKLAFELAQEQGKLQVFIENNRSLLANKGEQ